MLQGTSRFPEDIDSVTGLSVCAAPGPGDESAMAIRRRQDGCYCVDMAGWVDPFRRKDEPRHRSILRLLDLFRDQQGIIAGFHWAGPGDDRHYVCFSDVRDAESFAAYVGMEPVVTEYDDADPGRRA